MIREGWCPSEKAPGGPNASIIPPYTRPSQAAPRSHPPARRSPDFACSWTVACFVMAAHFPQVSSSLSLQRQLGPSLRQVSLLRLGQRLALFRATSGAHLHRKSRVPLEVRLCPPDS